MMSIWWYLFNYLYLTMLTWWCLLGLHHVFRGFCKTNFPFVGYIFHGSNKNLTRWTTLLPCVHHACSRSQESGRWLICNPLSSCSTEGVCIEQNQKSPRPCPLYCGATVPYHSQPVPPPCTASCARAGSQHQTCYCRSHSMLWHTPLMSARSLVDNRPGKCMGCPTTALGF